MRIKKCLAILLVIILLQPTIALAVTNYTVDPVNGEDRDPFFYPTYTGPFKTITGALFHCQFNILESDPETNIYLKPGTYSNVANGETYPAVVWWGTRNIIGTGESGPSTGPENVILDGRGLNWTNFTYTWEGIPITVEGGRSSELLYITILSQTRGKVQNITFTNLTTSDAANLNANAAIIVATGTPEVGSPAVVIDNCIFEGRLNVPGGPFGLGVLNVSSGVRVKNSIFYNLRIGTFSGQIMSSAPVAVTEFNNNTMFNSVYGIVAYNNGTYISARNNIVDRPIVYGLTDGTPFGWFFGLIRGEECPNMTLTYNNARSWTAGAVSYNGCTAGTGSTTNNPLFTNADIAYENEPHPSWDFHLKSRYPHDPSDTQYPHSSCIDAGDPNDSFVNEPVPNGTRINMGAYGNTTQAEKSITPQPATLTSEAALTYPQNWQPSSGTPLNFAYYLDANNDTWIYLYSISGELAWSIKILSGSNGAREGYNGVTWDGKTLTGDRIGNGAYVVRVISGSKKLKGHLVVID